MILHRDIPAPPARASLRSCVACPFGVLFLSLYAYQAYKVATSNRTSDPRAHTAMPGTPTASAVLRRDIPAPPARASLRSRIARSSGTLWFESYPQSSLVAGIAPLCTLEFQHETHRPLP